MSDPTPPPAASALIDALAALAQARIAVEAALHHIGVEGYQAPDRASVAQRTTSTQVMAVLAGYQEPITLIDVADGLAALRRGEDTPRPQGGTRYQEMARHALVRLIERGLVRRVEPGDKRGLMRFQRV